MPTVTVAEPTILIARALPAVTVTSVKVNEPELLQKKTALSPVDWIEPFFTSSKIALLFSKIVLPSESHVSVLVFRSSVMLWLIVMVSETVTSLSNISILPEALPALISEIASVSVS